MRHPSPLTIASLNLFNWAEPPMAYYDFEQIYTQVQWQVKKEGITRLIEHINADILCLQEVFSVEGLKELLQPLGYRYFSAHLQPFVSGDYIYSKPINLIASRLPLDSTKLLSAPEFERAPVQVSCQGIEIICVHLKSKRSVLINPDKENDSRDQLHGSYLSDFRRSEEADALSRHIKQASTQKISQPLVVMGDFNDEWHSSFLKPLKQLELAGIALACGDHRQATHFWGSQQKELDLAIINQELMSDDWLIEHSIDDNHIRFQSDYLSQFISDHAAVCLTISSIN